MHKKENVNNLRLASLFVLLVGGLVLMSLIVKLIFTVRESHFDGIHKFNLVISDNKNLNIVSFSPSNNSFSVLKVYEMLKPEDASKELKIPVDGIIKSKEKTTEKNVPSVIFNAILPLGNSYQKMTIVDLIRIFIFSRSVSENSIYVRELFSDLNGTQKSTLIALSFTDPSIYQENQSIEVINSTNLSGLGARIAEVISNMGGNVILVSGSSNQENKSKILYSGNITYTVRKLGQFLNFPVEESDKKGIADVIIIIGKDSVGKINF
ncbi:MAG TPA: LytR C-terminal domain-containing protein [Candidatus Sulfotelmatobacter sp.]|nr:LytR C-terminal domain-containing protein [Candidatus Sulfotelmatobacter sp.]